MEAALEAAFPFVTASKLLLPIIPSTCASLLLSTSIFEIDYQMLVREWMTKTCCSIRTRDSSDFQSTSTFKFSGIIVVVANFNLTAAP